MSERRFDALSAIAIALAALYVFWPQLDFYFTDVDTFTLISTSRFASWDEFVSMLSSPMMGGQLSNALFYRPVTSMTWAFDHATWGAEPGGYHLTGLFIHIATSLVFLRLMLGLTRQREDPSATAATRGLGSRVEALVAALLFAVHPIAMETVPAIARRPDLLFGLFAQLTLLSVLSYLRTERLRWLSAAALCCVLGIASKDSAISTPAIAIVFAICFSTRQDFGERMTDGVRVAVPVLSASAAYVALRIGVLGGVGGYAGDVTLSIGSVFKTSTGILICATGAPGNLDQCTPETLPLFGLGFAVLALACVVRLAPMRNEATTQRFAFGAVALLVFVTMFVVVRTPALTRTIYALLPFACMLVAQGVLDGAQWLAQALGRQRDSQSSASARSSFAVSASRVISGAIFALIAGSIVVGGFARVYLDEWRELGATMQDTLAMVAPHVETLDEGTVVYLVNFPHKISDPRPVWRDHPLFQDHSVQGWADLVYPQKRLDFIGLSQASFWMHQPREVSFDASFDSDRSRMELSLGKGGSLAAYPVDRPYGKRHPLRVASLENNEEGAHLAIDLTPEAMTPEKVTFLIYMGDRVELRSNESWTLHYEPTHAGLTPGSSVN